MGCGFVEIFQSDRVEAKMDYSKIVEDYLSNSVPHSKPFQDGLLAGLRGMQERIPSDCQYKCGTAECDAFFGGRLEGMKLYEQEKQKLTVY